MIIVRDVDGGESNYQKDDSFVLEVIRNGMLLFLSPKSALPGDLLVVDWTETDIPELVPLLSVNE